MTEANFSNTTLLDIEQALKEKLFPVKPDNNFIGQLRERLENSPVYRQPRRVAMQLLTTAAGLFAGLVIFLIGKRMINKKE
jgi:hypothetical protein